MNRDELIKAVTIAQELLTRQARANFKSFVLYSQDDYDMQWFHSCICDKLTAFERGEIKKMMILLPPQHGKSQLGSRLFPAYLLGKNPDRRLGLITYNDTFAQKFSRQVQRYIDNSEFMKLFPGTKLSGSKIVATDSSFARNLHEFEVVNKKGGMVTVGRGGQITGLPIDFLLIDDLYKNREEATSPTVAEKIWQDYNDVFKTRLHNDSQQLIMNTRWSDNDLAGRLLQEEPDEWVIIKFPAIRTEDINNYDIRQEGEALWPGRHSLERILSVKNKNQVTFNSLYQQDPKPNTDILVYGKKPWIEIPAWPDAIDTVTWGLDFGKSTGINALIRCAMVGNEDIYFDECLYESGVPVRIIKEVLLQYGYREGEIVYCDHMPTKITELTMETLLTDGRKCSVAAFPAIKGSGSVAFGIDKLKEYRCHYTSRSVNIKMELNNYQYVTYGKIITNEPVDDFNHALDACRYGTVSRFFLGR